MRLKDDTVRAAGLHHRLIEALFIADSVWRDHGQELVITSLSEPTARHSRTSLHYAGAAADLRTRYFTAGEKSVACDELRARLGDDYDVVEEPTHGHLEWQPKRPA